MKNAEAHNHGALSPPSASRTAQRSELNRRYTERKPELIVTEVRPG
jgi:hypothetical protein